MLTINYRDLFNLLRGKTQFSFTYNEKLTTMGYHRFQEPGRKATNVWRYPSNGDGAGLAEYRDMYFHDSKAANIAFKFQTAWIINSVLVHVDKISGQLY